MPLEYALQYDRPTPNPWKEMPSEKLELSGPIGIASLPEQNKKKVCKKGFVFNLMLLGQSGLGKTTLFNTIFDQGLMVRTERSFEERKEVKFTLDSFELEEGGVRVTVNVFESVELGVHLKKEDGIGPILQFLDERLGSYMDENDGPTRDLKKPDPRMHACLYFLPPSGHGLSELDMALISKIHRKVNLIPIISKADSFTPDEVAKFKKLVVHSINEQQIQVYPLSHTSEPLEGYPYAVIGSEGEYEVGDKKVRGRKFKWGVAQVDNLEHCDFVRLKDLLIKDGFDDLKIKTDLIFEEFRRGVLASRGIRDGINLADDDFQEKFAEERQAWLEKARKEEEELQAKFKKMIEAKEEELKKKEEELVQKRETMMRELENKKSAVKLEEDEVENQLGELDGDDDKEGKDEKKKKRVSLSGMTKSMRRK